MEPQGSRKKEPLNELRGCQVVIWKDTIMCPLVIAVTLATVCAMAMPTVGDRPGWKTSRSHF